MLIKGRNSSINTITITNNNNNNNNNNNRINNNTNNIISSSLLLSLLSILPLFLSRPLFYVYVLSSYLFKCIKTILNTISNIIVSFKYKKNHTPPPSSYKQINTNLNTNTYLNINTQYCNQENKYNQNNNYNKENIKQYYINNYIYNINSINKIKKLYYYINNKYFKQNNKYTTQYKQYKQYLINSRIPLLLYQQ